MNDDFFDDGNPLIIKNQPAKKKCDPLVKAINYFFKSFILGALLLFAFCNLLEINALEFFVIALTIGCWTEIVSFGHGHGHVHDFSLLLYTRFSDLNKYRERARARARARNFALRATAPPRLRVSLECIDLTCFKQVH